uniref:Uncharacterized protein n=1 Tax=Anopheles farauti TaxID=69004 RepID=A0A182R145_9DIPT
MTDLSMNHHPRPGSSTGFGSGNSIYDYPEHLNPFYEDENHKRLRFLEHKPQKSQRRGSLSSLRDGLRELWQFSTIRFGKKRSSTLGINKTSESPPPLRRNDYEPDSNDTFAGSTSGYRNTVSYHSASQSYTTTPLFVRHTRYRSSLQDRQNDNDDEIGFMRNDRYRSTIQNGFTTYNSGMVTSTPRKKQPAPQPYGTTSRAMQQQQHNNTNPFDTEMEPDGDTMSTISVDSSYSSTLRSRMSGTRTRTKRRAPPPPPVSVVPANRVEEPPVVDDLQSEDLRNLTAEIESFVRDSSINGASAGNVPPVESEARANTRAGQAFDVNNNSAQTEIPTTVSTIESELVREEEIGEDKKKESLEEIKPTNVEKRTAVLTDTSNNSVLPVVEQTTTTVRVDTTVIAPLAQSSPTPTPRKKYDKPENQKPQPEVTRQADIDFENLSLPETPVPTRRSNRENREKYITQEVTTVAKVTNEKPIIASSTKPQLTSTTEEADDDEGPTTTIIVDNLQYKLKVVPIHTEIDTKIENARMKISESTGNIPTAANDTNGTGTERRRSVRDIIESINKSQSMLKVNHEQSTNGLHDTQSTDSMTRNIHELNEREREIQSLLQDIDTRYGGSVSAAPAETGGDMQPMIPPDRRRSYYDNLADDNLNDNLDNSNMYAASGGYRVKKSPTKTVIIGETDDTQFQDCINWNPLPKPKRTHNLVDSGPDAEQQSSNGMVARATPSS